MTEFIIGRACADVSGRLRKKLLENVSGGRKALVIVPDQFAFETEKALYRAFAAEGRTELFTSVSVRTFEKLADELIAKYAGEKKPADDITKNILMYRAVSEIRDELSAFAKIALKPGFASRMTSTVTLFKTSGISAGEFQRRLTAISEDFRDSSPALFSKLGDIGRIYSAYDALLTASYSDRLDCTLTAARLAAEHGCFKGDDIYCDGFSDFSRSQLDFLCSMIDLANNMTFAFTSDTSEGCRDIFTTVNSTIALLKEHSLAADKPVSGAEDVICDNERFGNEALKQLSENIFTMEKADCPMDGVRLIRADDVYSEADFISAEIRRLTTEEGLRYNEIAVLCASPADYRTPLESAFDKYGVPLFCDIPESILHIPMVNLVTSLLALLKSFTTENVLSYLKTGFLQRGGGKPLTMRDINDFEDYIYTWDLKSENLKEPFPDENGKPPRAEVIRAEIIPPVLELRERLKGCTGDEITRGVCDFLFDTVGIQRAVAAHCKTSGSELLSDSDKELISSYQTLWNTLLEIFEALFKGLEGYKISLSDYCDLFRDICSATSLAKPPQTQDCVLVGDISRTRLDNVKAVFIAGACYGVFPSENVNSGLFSEYETELLGESVVKLGMNRRERYCYNRYLAYRAMSMPSERLYITCPALDISCTKMTPSDVVGKTLAVFGKSRMENASSFGEDFYCRSENAARQRYAAVSGANTEKRSTLRKALDMSGSREFTRKLDKLHSSRISAHKHRLDPDTAEALFRSRTVSATRLEKLNMCRFEYFCSNGLKIRERKRRNLSSMEVGNVVHFVLQKVLEEYCDMMDKFIALTRPQLSERARFYLDMYKAEALGGDYAKSLRFSYLYKNLTTGAVDILLLLQAEFAARDYRPKFFELRLGGEETAISPAGEAAALDASTVADMTLTDDAEITYKLTEAQSSSPESTNTAGSSRREISTKPLKIHVRDDISVDITGIIDRADIFTDKFGNEYIRVVDYKTGSREFSMVNLYYGINTQMLMYLIAVCDANELLKPGGVSYLPAKVTEPVKDKASAPFALLSQDHVQSGMYVVNDATAEEMNKYAGYMTARSGAKPEKFMPKAENSLSEEDFRILAEGCRRQTAQVLGKLYNGEVDAVPTVYKEKYNEKKACSYCRFEHICGHSEMHELHAVPPQEDDGEEGNG